MQTLFLVLTIVFTVALLVLVSVKVYSFAVYRRSAMATFAEAVIRAYPEKKVLKDTERVENFLLEKKKEPVKPFVVPKVKMKSKLIKSYYMGYEVYTFTNSTSPVNTVLYLHGGGYIKKPMRYHFRFCDRLSRRTNVRVIMPLYPLAPANTWEKAFVFLDKFYSEFKDEKNLVVMGDSAGGGLALAFTQYLLKEGIRMPSKLVLFSPWLDVSMANKEAEKYDVLDPMLSVPGLKVVGNAWSGELSVKDYKVSPIYGDVKGLCPVYLFTGDREIFYPDILRFKARLQREEVPHKLFVGKGLNHAYPLYPIPEADDVINELKDVVA